MTQAQAKLKLLTLQAQANKTSKIDMVATFTNLGLPQEIITRLEDLYDFSKKVAGQSLQIGKIIIIKLIEFVNENPNLSTGLMVGIGLSVLVGMLTSSIPIIGTALAPIASTITAMITIPVGVLRGHRLDKALNGEIVQNSLLEDLITLTKNFWALLVDIFVAIKDSFEEEK